jgi:hypothetical protein
MPLFRVAAVLLTILTAAGAAGQCLSDVRQVVSSDSLKPGPIAWSGRVLAVAGTETVSTRLFVTTFDVTGQQLSSVTNIPGTEGADAIGLVWNGTDFALFYEDSDHQLVFRRIGSDGKLIGTAPIRRWRLTLETDDQTEVLWSPLYQRYLIARIARGTRPGVWLSTLESDGDLEYNLRLDDPGEISSPLDIVMTETGTVGVFYQEERGDYIHMTVAEPSRVLRRLDRVWKLGESFNAVAKGTWFAMVRSVPLNAIRDAVQWKIFDINGNVIIPETQIAQIAKVEDARPLAFISTTEGFALAYLDRGASSSDIFLRLRRLDLEGGVIADTQFGPPTRRPAIVVDDLVFTGQTFLTVGAAEDEDDAFFISWCPLRARIEGPRTARPGETVTFTTIAEGGVPRYSYFWDVQFETKEGRVTSHTFTQPGTYQVKVSVTDETNARVTEFFTIEVIADVPGLQPGRRRAVRK